MDAEELDLIPTEDLVNAISRRVDAYILVTSKRVDAQDSDQEVSYSGGYVAAIGLCEYAKTRLLSNHVRIPPHGEGT